LPESLGGFGQGQSLPFTLPPQQERQENAQAVRPDLEDLSNLIAAPWLAAG